MRNSGLIRRSDWFSCGKQLVSTNSDRSREVGPEESLLQNICLLYYCQEVVIILVNCITKAIFIEVSSCSFKYSERFFLKNILT